jgi:hypothetical protein
MNVKTMGAFHALVHHIFHRQGGFLSGVERRRTDDSLGRSTSLYQRHLWFAQNLQGLVAYILKAKGGQDRSIQLNIAFIYYGLVNGQAGGSGHLRRRYRRSGRGIPDHQAAGDYQDCRSCCQ